MLKYANSRTALLILTAVFYCGCVDKIQTSLHEMQEAELLLEANPNNAAAQKLLVAHSKSSSAVIRANAVAFIGRLGLKPVPDEMRTVIYSALTDHDHAVRRVAVESLGKAKLDVTPVLGLLKAMLKDGNVDTAWFAAEVLGNAGTQATGAIPDLIDALNVKGLSGEPQLRVYAAEALGKMGHEARAALPQLKKLRYNVDPEFKDTVEAAIRSIEINK